LEDDVIAKPGYIDRIHEFIREKSDVHLPVWLMLEFSSLGFIGKLFKTSDIRLITQFILMFHRDKPVDWLLDLVFIVKYCSPEKPSKHCRQVING
jgi:alpha-1,3-mannosylglycoprotein beta-1,4-N-acetylglucosaminyltransferase A/B